MADVQVHGLNEVVRRLKTLPDRVQKRIIRNALKKGGEVIAAAATNNALQRFQGEGFLAEHITHKPGRRKKGSELRMIGVEGGAKKNETSPFYWRFLEFGTKHIEPAKPFLRPAFDANRLQVLEAMKGAIERGITREANRQR